MKISFIVAIDIYIYKKIRNEFNKKYVEKNFKALYFYKTKMSSNSSYNPTVRHFYSFGSDSGSTKLQWYDWKEVWEKTEYHLAQWIWHLSVNASLMILLKVLGSSQISDTGKEIWTGTRLWDVFIGWLSDSWGPMNQCQEKVFHNSWWLQWPSFLQRGGFLICGIKEAFTE